MAPLAGEAYRKDDQNGSTGKSKSIQGAVFKKKLVPRFEVLTFAGASPRVCLLAPGFDRRKIHWPGVSTSDPRVVF